MNIHKRTRLTPLDREEIWRLYGTREWTVVALSQRFRVSRPTIYKVIDRGEETGIFYQEIDQKALLAGKVWDKALGKD